MEATVRVVCEGSDSDVARISAEFYCKIECHGCEGPGCVLLADKAQKITLLSVNNGEYAVLVKKPVTD